MWHFCSAQIFTLLLISGQTDGQQSRVVYNFHMCRSDHVSDIQCSVFNSISTVGLKFNKEGDSLVIDCYRNPSAEQLERLLASIPSIPVPMLNLTNLELVGCPAPRGSESFGKWLSLMGSRVGSLSLRCIIRLTCSHPELTKDHVLTSAYVIIF